MRQTGRTLGDNRSGQLLIVAALVIALLISSTTVYVYELSKETDGSDTQAISDVALALKQSTRNTMISSLANVSNGGERAVLAANLNELARAFRSLHFGICNLAFVILNDSAYDSGTWLSWNTSNVDVSSAYVDFTLDVYGISAKTTLGYSVNVTTAFVVKGTYTVNATEKRVNLTCNVYNENKPALAKDMTVFYGNLGSWSQVCSQDLLTTDYGNGTYLLSFTIPSEAAQISVHTFDMREIVVEAIYDAP
jgi:hypothetical protein